MQQSLPQDPVRRGAVEAQSPPLAVPAHIFEPPRPFPLVGERESIEALADRLDAGEAQHAALGPAHAVGVLRLAPYVAEAEKGERRAIRFRMSFPIGSFEAEVDEARLVGMELKLVPTEALAQNAEDPRGV